MIRLKNEREIDGIRKSCHALADLFRFIVPQVRAGMTTKEIDDLCVGFIKSVGGTPAWYREDFPGAACVSVNNEVIHGIPSAKRVVRDGDLVSLDIGIDLDGYISDSTHTVMVGNVRPEIRRLVRATRESLAAGIAACVAGNRIKDISKAVYAVAGEKYGYGVVYDFCGHGVGLDVHEDPSVPNVAGGGPNPRIQPGMVLAIEPMVNLGVPEVSVAKDGWTVLTGDGKWSCHEEHTVAVFADRTEVLTECAGLPAWA